MSARQDYQVISHFDSRQVTNLYSSRQRLSSDGLGWNTLSFNHLFGKDFETPEYTSLEHGIGFITKTQTEETDPSTKLIEYRHGNNFGSSQNASNTHGSFMILPKNHIYWTAVKGSVEFITLYFKPENFNSFAFETIEPAKVELLFHPLSPNPDYLFTGILESIKQYLEQEPQGDDFYIEHLENLLYAHLLKNYCAVKHKLKNHNGLPPYKLKLAFDYIESSLSRKITINEVAQLLDLSPGYFSRLFKESTGKAPYHYIQQQRLHKAQDLLCKTKLSIIDIAFECGFNSQSKMTHYFRSHIGTTPKKYRDSQ